MNVMEAFRIIRELGLTVRRFDGEWRINYRGGGEATAYYTTDTEDAVHTARAFITQMHPEDKT